MTQPPTVRPDSSWRFELTGIPLVNRVLKWRPLQFVLVLTTMAFFVLALLTAFFGTQAGNRNFSIIFVWIVWWALVIILMVPAAGRAWCGICPIPAPGEWIQRQSFVHPRRRKLWTLGKRWPKRLKNIWLQNGMFLTVALFSAIILTRPAADGHGVAGFHPAGRGPEPGLRATHFLPLCLPCGRLHRPLQHERAHRTAGQGRGGLSHPRHQGVLSGQRAGLWLPVAGLSRQPDAQHALRPVYRVPEELLHEQRRHQPARARGPICSCPRGGAWTRHTRPSSCWPAR